MRSCRSVDACKLNYEKAVLYGLFALPFGGECVDKTAKSNKKDKKALTSAGGNGIINQKAFLILFILQQSAEKGKRYVYF